MVNLLAKIPKGDILVEVKEHNHKWIVHRQAILPRYLEPSDQNNGIDGTRFPDIVEWYFLTKRMKKGWDIFLYSCFTGLAYEDVKKLKIFEIAESINGQDLIFASRQKTDTNSWIPLLSKAMGF